MKIIPIDKENTGGYILPEDFLQTVYSFETTLTEKDYETFKEAWDTSWIGYLKEDYNQNIKQERNKTMVFQVIIIEEPSKNEMDDGVMEKLILGPITVVAKDRDSAGALVCMEHANELKDVKKERMKVLTKSFL
jgi:hypothetical protein